MKKPWVLFFLCALCLANTQAQNNVGELRNLVCFVRFADEEQSVISKTAAYYDLLFNNQATDANSVYNYFRQASYQQLSWSSLFFPAASGSQIVSYKALNNRAFYLHQSSINPDGYEDDAFGILKAAREAILVKEVSNYLNSIVPADALVDANSDGFVDNLSIIISGNSEISGKYLLWPHRSALLTQQNSIAGKKVGQYMMLFDGQNGFSLYQDRTINTGVLCHEMSHILGTYDLYHAGTDKQNPIGIWDLMSDNLTVPQQMSAYTKSKYCKWIAEIPEIKTPGTYTLHPVGGSTSQQIAYKIKPIGSDEYFIVEYRKKEGLFDLGLPGSGLLVYRVDTRFLGNENYDGNTKLNELYIFRPGGTPTQDGNLANAFFSQESGRVAFGGESNYKPFYSNGTEAKFAIANISTCDETIKFDLLPFAPQIYLSQPNVSLSGSIGNSAQFKVESSIPWTITSVPDWLTVSSLAGEAGVSIITLTTKTANAGLIPLTAQVVFVGNPQTTVVATATIVQQSNVIQAPYGLKAQQENQTVKLSWQAPYEGSPVFSDSYENESSSTLWTQLTANGKKWNRLLNTKYVLPYDGSYCFRLDAESIDRHQDEKLISPTFANGRYLSFYSKSIAPKKINPHNFYFVEVSSDGGQNWTAVWDLKTNGNLVNAYERIDIDLSPYLSDNMQIAFRAWDDNNIGLSYWWQVDAVSIYPNQNSTVVQYQVFRNNVLIAGLSNCNFVDEAPLPGANTYSIKAVKTEGVSSSSIPVIFNFITSGIGSIPNPSSQVHHYVEDNILTIKSDNTLGNLTVFNQVGIVLMNKYYTENSCNINICNWPNGVYVFSLQSTDRRLVCTRKFIK